MWRAWREREGLRRATADETSEARIAEERPTVPYTPETDEATTPPWRHDPLWQECDDSRLATEVEQWESPELEETPALAWSFETEGTTSSGRQGAFWRERAEHRIATDNDQRGVSELEEGSTVPPSFRADATTGNRYQRPFAAAIMELLGRKSMNNVMNFIVNRTTYLNVIGGLLIVTFVFLTIYNLYYPGRHGDVSSLASREHLAQEAFTGAGESAPSNGTEGSQPFSDEEASAAHPSQEIKVTPALLEELFSFKYADGLGEQILTVDGCDAVLAEISYDASSGARERQELSRFQMNRFHLIESAGVDRLFLAADAGADTDLLLWYDALEEATDLDEERWVQTLSLRIEAGEFGPFAARNRHETQVLSSDGAVQAPIPSPLLQVALRLPEKTAAPAEQAWRTYVGEHCSSG